jgi:hypothetical protein
MRGIRPTKDRKVSAWWVGAPALLVLLSGFFLLLFLRPWSVAGDLPDAGMESRRQSVPPETSGSAEDWKGALPAEVARLFTSASSHEERLGLVSDPRRDGYWMEMFFREGPGASEKVREVTPMEAAGTDSAYFERFRVSMEDGGDRLLCVVINEQGGKVDFRSYARFCSESWEELLAGRTRIAEEVRVFIGPGTTYFGSFSDDSKWTSYIATSPDIEESLYFHAARGSDTDTLLSEMTAGGAVRATLAIRSNGIDHTHRQFEVTDVLTPGWVK